MIEFNSSNFADSYICTIKMYMHSFSIVHFFLCKLYLHSLILFHFIPEIDEDTVMQLASMGFSVEGCKRAVFNTGNQGNIGVNN